jgi:hypothetical protein
MTVFRNLIQLRSHVREIPNKVRKVQKVQYDPLWRPLRQRSPAGATTSNNQPPYGVEAGRW